MRTPALAILAIGMASTEPAAAQTYNPAYPVCQHVYRAGANYYDCSYTSLPQCNASASGRAAERAVNPYFAGVENPAAYRRHGRAAPTRAVARDAQPASVNRRAAFPKLRPAVARARSEAQVDDNPRGAPGAVCQVEVRG